MEIFHGEPPERIRVLAIHIMKYEHWNSYSYRTPVAP